MNSTTIIKLSFLILASFHLNYSFSQNSNESIPTIEGTTQKIEALQTKIISITARINQLKSQYSNNLEQYNYIISLENSKEILIRDLKNQENIKASIVYAQENKLIQDKNSNQPTDHTYKASQIIVIKQVDFDALPENKKLEILANPTQYEISK